MYTFSSKGSRICIGSGSSNSNCDDGNNFNNSISRKIAEVIVEAVIVTADQTSPSASRRQIQFL